jgi:hypothetical protein
MLCFRAESWSSVPWGACCDLGLHAAEAYFRELCAQILWNGVVLRSPCSDRMRHSLNTVPTGLPVQVELSGAVKASMAIHALLCKINSAAGLETNMHANGKCE